MAVSAAMRRNDPIARPTSWSYALYGLTIESELELPIAPRDRPEAEPELRIRRFDLADCPAPEGPAIATIACEVHPVDVQVHRGPGGAWIWTRAVGWCHISPDLRRADFYLESNAELSEAALVAVGPCLVFIRNMLRKPVLHASGLVLDGSAVAFLGPAGRGKSTMAAAFMRLGATVLGDDILPLNVVDGVVYGQPSVPFMKLFQETAESTLGVEAELPRLWQMSAKRMLRFGSGLAQPDEAPLRAIYILDRSGGPSTDISTRSISRREAMAALLAQTGFRRSMLPAEEAWLLPFFAGLLEQAPVRVLSFPTGFEHQAAVFDCVRAELASRP